MFPNLAVSNNVVELLQKLEWLIPWCWTDKKLLLLLVPCAHFHTYLGRLSALSIALQSGDAAADTQKASAWYFGFFPRRY